MPNNYSPPRPPRLLEREDPEEERLGLLDREAPEERLELERLGEAERERLGEEGRAVELRLGVRLGEALGVRRGELLPRLTPLLERRGVVVVR